MIIKCKMCGGDIEFTSGTTFGTCLYCGSTSTIPKTDNDSKLNSFNRANHFRRQCEFDKAVAAYEKILEQDDTAAEAYWGAVISRYGIEYVEDPATKKRIPTCHRVQMTSILADEDYKAAIANAPDTESRRLYEEEATRIAEIQKRILTISQNEKPYDVFICYKETDESGRRTHDSQWAQDVYYGLTEQGYKVFFSRITLEDKLGQEYEPYIFAALNSARVMVVICSKPEYINAVWVKNEWSRYLDLMAKDRKRLLIPCYRDMDPYDLPDELSNLQSQDMSKIGFMQDLIRGIRKVLEADKVAEQPKIVQKIVQTGTSSTTPSVSNLMDRVYLFMEDGDFDSAEEYLNRVLDIDSKHAPAYAAKVCVAFHIRKESGLADLPYLYEDNPDWQKAMRFAGSSQRAVYESYISQVKERVSCQIRNYAYDCAIEAAINPKAIRYELDAELTEYRVSCEHSIGKRADGSCRIKAKENEVHFQEMVKRNEPGDMSETNLKTAADMFEAIGDSEAIISAEQCKGLAEQARQKRIYTEARRKSNGQSAVSLDEAAQLFESVPEYKNARLQAKDCRTQAETIRDKLYTHAQEIIDKAGDSSNHWKEAKEVLENTDLRNYRDVSFLLEEVKKHILECEAVEADMAKRRKVRKTRNKVVAVLASLFIIIVVVFIMTVIIPKSHYDKGILLQHSQNWMQAIEEFKQAGNYSDAATQIFATYYAEGIEKRNNKDWYGAVTAFTNAGNYNDSAMQIQATYYAEGQAKLVAKDWNGAVVAFTSAGNFSDSATQIKEVYYQQATELKKAGKYIESYSIYSMLRDYKDVDSLLKNDQNLYTIASREATFTVGKYVAFGHYPHTRAGTDNTAIEWLVLARDGQKALLISRYALDCQKYQTGYSGNRTTWQTCTLRAWLNDTFFNKAFTSKEQKAILTTTVDNSKSQGASDAVDENATQDRVFLLSIAEANLYFSDSEARKCAPTDYAVAQGAYKAESYTISGRDKVDGKITCWWWLRTHSHNDNNYAYAVTSSGGVGGVSSVNDVYDTVRPVIWIDLESGVF